MNQQLTFRLDHNCRIVRPQRVAMSDTASAADTNAEPPPITAAPSSSVPPQLPAEPAPSSSIAAERSVTFANLPKDMLNSVVNAPDMLMNEAVKKTARFRPRGMVVFTAAFSALVLLGVGLVSRVGQVNTVSSDGSTINAYATLWTVCVETVKCPSSLTASPAAGQSSQQCSFTSTCADPATFNCQQESSRYFAARACYITAMLISIVLAVLGALDALRKLPGNFPGRVVSLRGLLILVSVAVCLTAFLGFMLALATWFGVHCGPAVSNVPGSQPGRAPFLALLGAMASAGATTSAWVTRTRFEVLQEEAARAADANGMVSMDAVEAAAQAEAQLSSAGSFAAPQVAERKKRRKKWLYDDPDEP